MTLRKLVVSAGSVLGAAMVFISAPVYGAQEEEGGPRCAINAQMGGACSDVTGSGWWSGCAPGATTDQNGTISYKTAEGICDARHSS